MELSSTERDARGEIRRRQFLVSAGLAAGGLGLTAQAALGQDGGSQPPPITTDEPEDCAPVPTPPAQPIPFQPDPNRPLRSRVSAFQLDANGINKLKAAFQALRALPPTDPRSWIRQANVHCWYCGGGLDSMAGEEIHQSWWFFPWHRCYLYFFERILGTLIGDDTFALPYWDWDNVEDRTLPPPYTNPNDASNPAFDAMRGVTPQAMLPLSAVGPQIMNPIMQLPDWQEFLGTQPNGETNTGGQIENGPHGYVHLWTGKPSMYLPWGAPDMGVLATAAQDPVFFAHHANIDRLWDVWVKSNPQSPWPPDSDFYTHTWTFYDENQQWRSISVNDVLQTENLNYTYGTKPAPKARTMMAAFSLPSNGELHTEAQTAKIQVPGEVTQLFKAPAPRRRFILHIDGVSVPEGQAAHVRVFLNKPNADVTTSTEDPDFVGYFVIVPMSRPHKPKPGAHAMQKRGHLHNYAFDVTGRVTAVQGQEASLAVTLVPVGTDKDKPQGMNVTYQRIYLKAESR